MGHVGAEIEVEAPLAAVERLWFDLQRWPSFIDGFANVAKQEGGWPAEGSRLVWSSTPHGRGRVVERVVGYQPGSGQTVAVEDPRLRGTQRVQFEPLEDGTAVALSLEYELKQATVFTPLVDLLFIRRALRDSLKRTLLRFGRELKADAELLG